MFSLIKGLWTLYFQKPTYKILMIGLDDAGKTTILNQLKNVCGQKFTPNEKITPTVGLNIARLEMSKFSCLFWDLGGQKLLRSIWKKYYSECHGIVYVIDSTNESRYQENQSCLKEVLQNKDLQHVPILILMNKSELTLEASDKLFMKLDINIQDRDFTCQKCSAFEKTNLIESIQWLSEAVGDFYKKVQNPKENFESFQNTQEISELG